MVYQCRDCSYQGDKFPQGICPACHSSNIVKTIDTAQANPQKRSASLLILIAVWAYLAYLLFDKFST